jgi:polyisoprenoid-binding protein YceI
MAAFTASTEVNREDWGLTWNMAVETGGVLVGKTVKLEIDAELLLQS